MTGESGFDDKKTLADAQYHIGDYIDISITTPRYVAASFNDDFKYLYIENPSSSHVCLIAAWTVLPHALHAHTTAASRGMIAFTGFSQTMRQRNASHSINTSFKASQGDSVRWNFQAHHTLNQQCITSLVVAVVMELISLRCTVPPRRVTAKHYVSG